MPHTMIPGLEDLDAATALAFAVSVRRAAQKHREQRADDSLRSAGRSAEAAAVKLAELGYVRP